MTVGVHFERTTDLGKTWETVGPVNDGREIAAIQPAFSFTPRADFRPRAHVRKAL